MRYMHPRDWQERMENMKKSGHKDPEKDTLARARVKFDCAAMLAHRECHAAAGPTYRYLACDASPQKRMGYEVFVSRERVVLRSSLAGKTMANISEIEVESRMLPVAGLGQGHCGVANKVHANLHQTWLDYGPDEHHLRSACNDVRQVLTDMGPEFDVADYGDILPGYLGQQIGIRASDTGQRHLYPLALQVPGIRHIMDWIIQDVLYDLDFWPAFNKDTTRIIAYFNKARHRDLIKKIVLAQAPPDMPDMEAMLQSLKKGTQVWAHWRWQTLSRTLADMRRIESVAKFTFQLVRNPSKELSMRNASEADMLRTSVLQDELWDQVCALQYLLKWPMHLSTWIRGCDCHNDELAGHAGRTIVCPWKGCRARSVTKEYLDTLDRIAEDRSRLEEGMFGLVPTGVIHSAMTKLMSRIEMKLHWLQELPYLIWRADDPDIASNMVMQYDVAMADARRAPHVHRVAHHFMHPTSNLRTDMERHASGHGMSPKLAQEILSYQLCMLDDTFQEAPHRDISGIVKKAPGSKPAWWFSSLRVTQNIKLSQKMDEEKPTRFAYCFQRWKAVMQTRKAAVSGKLVTVRDSRAATIRQVYRIGSVNLEELPYTRPAQSKEAESALHATQLRDMTLRKDFLRSVVLPGKLFTLPGITSFRAIGTDTSGGQYDVPERPLCFEIVDLDTFTKKHVKTARVRSMLEYQFPAMVQKHCIHRFRDYPGHRQTVFPDGKPQEIDILNMGVSFTTLMTDMCEWSVQRESDVKGCITLHNPELISQRQWLPHPCNIDSGSDTPCGHVIWPVMQSIPAFEPVTCIVQRSLTDKHTPAIIFAKALKDQGWTYGPQAPAYHASDTQLVYVSDDPVKRKSYFQCLLMLPDLSKRGLDRLSSQQVPLYYECVLSSDNPGQIPLGQGQKFYAAVLKGQKPSPDLPLQDKHRDIIIGQGRGASARTSADEIDMDRRADPRSDARAQCGHGISPRPAQRPATDMIIGHDVRQPWQLSQVAQATGYSFMVDEHGIPGQPGHYRRYKLVCPLAACGHKLGTQCCQKYRNMGVAQTQLGLNEPFAYLAVWADGAAHHKLAKDHIKWRPPQHLVREYMIRAGWLRP